MAHLSDKSLGRNRIDETKKEFEVSANKILSSIKARFEAFGVRINLRISSTKKKLSYKSFQFESRPIHNVHIDLTTQTPEEYASELLSNPCRFRQHIEEIITHCTSQEFDVIAAPAIRGIQVGSIVARELHKRFIPIRKAKKGGSKKDTVKRDYYYGDVLLKVPRSIKPGERVLLTDDDLLKGGTGCASDGAIELAGGRVVGVAVLIEWPQWEGRQRLEGLGLEVFSSVKVFGVL